MFENGNIEINTHVQSRNNDDNLMLVVTKPLEFTSRGASYNV